MPRPQFSLKSLLWLMVVVAAFFAGTRSERWLAERRPDPMETRIWAALDEKTDLDFSDQPFADVIEYLKQRHDIEIQLDRKALTDAGVATDTPVTRNIKGITLRSALRLLLSNLGLTYVVDNGVLAITTTEALYPWLRFKTMLWLVVVVAAFLGGIQIGRKWRPHSGAHEPATTGQAENQALSRRFQFGLKWLFVTTLVVAAYFGGMATERRLFHPTVVSRRYFADTEATSTYEEVVSLPDGTHRERVVHEVVKP